ncbi:MAG TPA: IS4 family transposase, partial [Pseudoalteromonas sp.]|nr:IS4 family transposase [Pseudoalteromonas sp.]
EKDVLPDKVPSLHWLYYSLAKLGGWYDSKRNGRVGVKALWKGWLKLADMVESAELLISIQQTEKL